jgi:hypothetical protein
MLLAICVGGVGLIVYSRYERLHPAASAAHTAATVPPTKANLWEVGLEVDICGKINQIPASTGSQAFSTNGHGVVTIEPGLATTPALYSGKNANLQAFLLPLSVLLSPTRLELPGKSPTTTTTTTSPSTTTAPTKPSTTTSSGASSTTSSTSTSTTTTTTPAPKPKIYSNGASCDGGKGTVQVKEWKSPSAKTGSLVTNAAGLRFRDGQLITIAFLPKGAAIPKPRSAAKIAAFLLSNPGGVAPANVAPVTSSTLPITSTTTSGTATTTTTGSASTSTTAPGSSSTATKSTKSKGSKKSSG